MSENLMKLNGKITYVLYHNEDNFYTVAKFQINDENERIITITGNFVDIIPEILYNIYGNYIEHPKYGMQFQVVSYDKPMPDEKEGIVRYLSGIQFPGIGKKTAEKIVKALGDNCLSELKKDINILRQVPGISEKHFLTIEEGLKNTENGLEELIQYFNVSGIGIRNLIRLNRTYGRNALEKIKENPYRVIEECDGFGFITADKIGKTLGIVDDDPRRLYALLVSLAMDCCMQNGDSYVLVETLLEVFKRRSGQFEELFESLLNEAIMNRSLHIEDNRIFPISQYDAENFIAKYLASFPVERLDPIDRNILEKYLLDVQNDFQIEYEEIQTKAILDFFDKDIMILTGGPGTGKTTVIRAMIALFKLIYPNYEIACVAPTGRAAKRLSELTNCEATTIHSLLKWDLETNRFGKNESEPLNVDLIIIDEFSMVDSWLFYNLLKAGQQLKKICIVGDEDQLPSVGPGSVLRDLIETNLFSISRLKQVYRQEEGSGILALASDVRDGFISDTYGRDILFHECKKEMIKDTIINVVKEALEKGYDLNDIQVLSPMYNGVAGIDVLNNALQECFNGKDKFKREVKIGYMTLREGDKILQLKNQPDDGVYNGDIGILVEIIEAKESDNNKTTIVVDFQDIYVEYNQENWNNITLAYCTSVHKAQGNEYPIVIMPFTYQMSIMLQRKLIYTGITRASKALVLLGELDAMRKGVEIIERHPRETTLVKRIMQYEK